MCKQWLAVVLINWVIFSSVAPYSAAQSKNDPHERHAARVRAAIQRIGTGNSAHVNLELYDKTKLSGSIVEIADERFIVRDANTGKDMPISYSNVKKLKGGGPGLAKKIAFGASAFQSKAGLIVLVALLATVFALVATDKS
jgi:hypothetical protein